jgi:hypothetical protein
MRVGKWVIGVLYPDDQTCPVNGPDLSSEIWIFRLEIGSRKS